MTTRRWTTQVGPPAADFTDLSDSSADAGSRTRNTGGHNPVDGGSVSEDVRLWHVVVTVSGSPMEPLIVRGALQRLSEERPFLSRLRFGSDRAEICYWDEGPTMLDVASLALRLWNEHRDTARLPSWEVVGLEVVEQDVRHSREQLEALTDLIVVPQPF